MRKSLLVLLLFFTATSVARADAPLWPFVAAEIGVFIASIAFVVALMLFGIWIARKCFGTVPRREEGGDPRDELREDRDSSGENHP